MVAPLFYKRGSETWRHGVTCLKTIWRRSGKVQRRLWSTHFWPLPFPAPSCGAWVLVLLLKSFHTAQLSFEGVRLEGNWALTRCFYGMRIAGWRRFLSCLKYPFWEGHAWMCAFSLVWENCVWLLIKGHGGGAFTLFSEARMGSQRDTLERGAL